MLVQPETVIRWHRAAFQLYWRWKSSRGKTGRPKINAELRALIRQMARDNLWRAPRIHKELVRLGVEVSERTVARTMPRLPPSPAQRQSWRTFLENHRHAIAAMDLFVVPTITFELVYGFFVIHHVIVLNEEHLRKLVREYVAFHNADRCHYALGGDAPDGRPIEPRPSPTAKVTALPRLGGRHHRYEWRQAA